MTSARKMPLAPGEMTPAQANRAVRDGTLKRRSLRDLDQVIDDMIANAPSDWLAKMTAIINRKP